MLKVIHSTNKEDCIKFMNDIFKNPNSVILENIKNKSPKSIAVHWNSILGKGVVSFCYHVITKTERDYQWIAEPFETEDLKNVS